MSEKIIRLTTQQRLKIIVFTILFSVIADNLFSQEVLTNATQKIKQSPEEYWLYSLRNGKVKSALKVAGIINSKTQKVSSITGKYAEIAKNEGVDPAFFSEPFNQRDFKLWYDAWFFKQIVKQGIAVVNKQKIKDKNSTLARLLFGTVVKRIKAKEEKIALIPWPSGIWIRKFGVCDRMSWLFAELAYQAGFETQIVYLINPDTGESPHTICEVLIEDDAGKVTRSVADPLSKVFLLGKSVADLANDKALMKKIWPDKKEWREALPHSLFWTPSYPQDYCVKNQLLYKMLKPKLGSNCPRFGEDPEKRMLRYKKLTNGNKEFKMGLWYYPFRLLKRELETRK